MIGLNVPVSAECEPDKSDRHQDGPGYDQPMGIIHLSVPSSRSFSARRLQHEPRNYQFLNCGPLANLLNVNTGLLHCTRRRAVRPWARIKPRPLRL
jgi:hypothetical protein